MSHTITTSPTTPTAEKLNTLIQTMFAQQQAIHATNVSYTVEKSEGTTSTDEKVQSINDQRFGVKQDEEVQ